MNERKGEPGLDDPPEEEDEVRPGAGGFVPDIVRRAVLTGVGALFMTEEGIRNLVSDLKLPKDALAFLLSQADRTRGEVTRVVTQEMRRFLESETLRREIWKVLTGVTLEVNATIQLKPSGSPGFKARFRRRQGAPGDPPRKDADLDEPPESSEEPSGPGAADEDEAR
jgi:hypothetical protein